MFIRLCVRLSFCFIWLLTFAFSVCWPQEISSLNGRILHKDNRLPLAGANVYLNNTTLGTCSHADGSFQIKSVPSGFYHLVVSLIGYQTVIQPLTIEPNHSDTLNIVLEPKELVLEDITVTGSIDKKWKKLLKILESVLLGSQAKEKQTRLLNPYCINIRQNQETDIIEADADSLLHIENLSLGYLLFVNLRYFSWKPGNGGGYRIQVRFYPLEPQDDSEIKTWEENRRRAYFGSFRHFLGKFTNFRTLFH